MGPIRESAPGEVAIGPVMGTRMACSDPQAKIEDRFLAALGKTTRYNFVAGKLVLSGIDGGATRSLSLARRQRIDDVR
jgi:heat shock protein HslJ